MSPNRMSLFAMKVRKPPRITLRRMLMREAASIWTLIETFFSRRRLISQRRVGMSSVGRSQSNLLNWESEAGRPASG